MSKENGRNVWKYDETKEMLQIMLDNNFVQSFSTKHNINVQIYRKIEKMMIERGFRHKTYEQIAVRWKNLKNLFMRAKRSNNQNERQLFPFYDEVDELLALSKRKPRQITIQPKLPAPSVKAANRRIATIKTEPIETSSESMQMEITLEEPDSAPDETLEERLEEDEEEEQEDDEEEEDDETLSVRIPRGRIYNKRRLMTVPKRPNRLQSAIAASRQDLSDEFFRIQKRLIDYEFSLYAQREEEYLQQINITTKELLEENMEAFFVRLKEFMDEQRAELADEETPR